MDLSLMLTMVVRFVHIASITTLVGGMLFARLVAGAFTDDVAKRWRPVSTVAVVLAFLSGLYTLINKTYAPPGYHMWFGIKFLLALHVMAVAIVLGRNATVEKRKRLLTGTSITGICIIAISAYLRWMR